MQRLPAADRRPGATGDCRYRWWASTKTLLAAAQPAVRLSTISTRTRWRRCSTPPAPRATPKGVYFTHRQLVLHTLNARGHLGAYEGQPLLRSDDVYMPDHADVPRACVGRALRRHHAGDQAGVPRPLRARTAWCGLYREEKVTFSHCVPTILQMMLNCEQGAAHRFQRLEDPPRRQRADLAVLASQGQRHGMLIDSGYGMSETCPLLSLTHLRDADLAVHPGRAVRPADQDRRAGARWSTCDRRCRGQCHAPRRRVAGRNRGARTLADPRLSAASRRKAPSCGTTAGCTPVTWPRSTAMGGVEIKDRIKDVIKTGGEWISSLALENLISRHRGGERRSRWWASPDEQWGERPMALVVRAQTGSP